jgi:adenosylcobinamide-phosphate synthase
MSFALAMLVAMATDALLGWSDRLYRNIGHPVTWIGAMIRLLDTRFNRAGDGNSLRRLAGACAAISVITVAAGLAALAQALLPPDWIGTLLLGVLAWPLVAVRSMYVHVAAVVRPLMAKDIVAARLAVSMIVGRDPSVLDSAGVARAALESLAENSSDGIVAPLFWGALFGLPGIAAYKAINTLDSMIGHRSPRHESFGWAAARIDDVVNLIPARLTGLLFAAMSGRPAAALRCMWQDAGKHRSPNAGWPEAAMAGALAVRMSGPRIYGDRVAAEPWLNGAAPDPVPQDMQRALALYLRAMAALAALLGVVGLSGLA